MTRSFYVKRTRADGTTGWTGPIRSPRQASKEAEAWIEAGCSAEVVPSSREVRAEVRAWDREQRRRREVRA